MANLPSINNPAAASDGGRPGRKPKRYAKDLLADMFQKVGWSPRPTELCSSCRYRRRRHPTC